MTVVSRKMKFEIHLTKAGIVQASKYSAAGAAMAILISASQMIGYGQTADAVEYANPTSAYLFGLCKLEDSAKNCAVRVKAVVGRSMPEMSNILRPSSANSDCRKVAGLDCLSRLVGADYVRHSALTEPAVRTSCQFRINEFSYYENCLPR